MSKGLGQSENRVCRSFDIATLQHFAALIVHSRASCLCASVNANSFSSGCHSPLTCGAYPFSAHFLVPHGAAGRWLKGASRISVDRPELFRK